MSPATTRICFTAFEATKNWCLDIPTLDTIISALVQFFYDFGGSDYTLLNTESPVAQ